MQKEEYLNLRNNDSTTNNRGYVIVDSSTLFELMPEIPKDHNDGLPNKRYLDILPFLAKNGYNIIIPEIVSFETSQILENRINIGNYFGNRHGNNKYNSVDEILKPFMKSVANNEYPNISILANTGPRDVDNFLSELKQLEKTKQSAAKSLKNDKGFTRLSNHNSLTNLESNKIASKQFEFITKSTGYANNAERNTREKFGNLAIMELLKDRKILENNKNPIYVLTNNRELKEEISKLGNHSIKTSNSSDLLYSCSLSGVGKKIGFPENISTADFNTKRFQDYLAITKGKREATIKPENAEYVSRMENSLLAMSLTELNKTLDEQKENDKTANSNSGANSSQVDKFLRKYGKKSLGNPDISTEFSRSR